jgi:hypothetical protein
MGEPDRWFGKHPRKHDFFLGPNMYTIFDPFLSIDSWYTRQPADQERFFHALRKIIHNRNFNAEAIAEHFDRSPARARVDDEAYLEARDYYVAAAAVVRRYVQSRTL